MSSRPPITIWIAVSIFIASLPTNASDNRRGGRTNGDDHPSRVLVLDGSPVHNAGDLHLHASNWGVFGSQPGSANPFSSAPSGEWPAGTGIEHVYTGGLWVGAIRNGVPAVSTAAFEAEFRPTADPLDIVYYSSEGTPGGNRLPNPLEDDDSDGLIEFRRSRGRVFGGTIVGSLQRRGDQWLPRISRITGWFDVVADGAGCAHRR